MDVPICVSSFLALVLYMNTLDADFAYDDSRAIVKNQDLEPKTPIINIFYDDFWGTPLTKIASHKSYRPICVLSFRLNYYLGALNPWGYHLGNVILHVIVTALFTKLSRTLLKHSFPTLVSGVLFASHPVHTEAVAGVVGRADIGACFFFLLALLSYMKYVKLRDTLHDPGGGDSGSKRFVFFIGTAVLTTASLLTKEQGVTVLGVCAAYDLFVHNKMKIPHILQFYKKDEWRRAMEGFFLLVIVLVTLVAFRMYFMGNTPPEFAPSDNPASDSDSFLTRTLTYFLLPALNVWILLCPRVLSFDWSMSSIPLVESVSDYRNIFTLTFYTILAYFVLTILNFIHSHSEDKVCMNGNGHSGHGTLHGKYSAGKQKQYSRQSSLTDQNVSTTNSHSPTVSSHSIDVLIFSAALMVLPFVLATNLFFYVGFVIAERVLYIPSMGFCMLIAHGVHIIYKRYDQDGLKQKCVVLATVFLVLMNSGKTVVRNRDWASEEMLYTSGIAVNPPKAWGNLANIYNNQGRITDAETAYRNALKYRPNMSDTHYNLGILLQNQKRYKDAIDSYNKAISFRPNLSMAHLNLGILLAQLGDKKQAEQVYRHCADLDTSKLKDPRLHESTKISCLYNLGRLYNDQKQFEDAMRVFEEALQRRPDHYAPQSIYNLYGETHFNMGNHVEAERYFKKALQAKPDHIPAHLTMAKLFHKQGKNEEAESWFLKAKHLDPSDNTVYQHYALFLGEVGRLTESASLYKDILEKDPENFEMIFNAANVLRQVGQNGDAEKMFIKATQLRPEEATAHMNLGAMYHINNKLTEAEKSYTRALELKPGDRTTQENLAKLKTLMSSKH
ncbi:protein O-mannosyl-transferase TMTC2-like isoform X1 [Dreissena polymorpha]|uniref:protein O-mannosyl-transferase TMTC2-like isoform X1 n=1 Tax=Dreissena polymorpha TaxID=45954 RepID=UPI0022648CD5|nr:protein O-mannosyl-transferase TMTC2-like isoform X1 [Dreissena polymorpha]